MPEHETQDSYAVTFAREFRYDGARARYLNRELDPTGLMESPVRYTSLSDVWTDYDGEEAYRDYTLASGTAAETMAYELGIGKVADPRTANPTRLYYHTDHLGTTRFMSNAEAQPVYPAVYTAFGERVSGYNYRYGYVGADGYQAHDFPKPPDADAVEPIPFLHVGRRYYDPTTGRFLQRDPIGIGGETGCKRIIPPSETLAARRL